jgi:broad specificity phosphatase PhoE
VPLIYLVRHAENRANVERLMSHKVIDYSLTDLGREQAEALGRWFLDRALDAVYTSPLKRARETAEQIAAATGAPIVEAEPLRELDVGRLDGSGDDASWAVHDELVARWRTGDWEARFPGGESYREAYDRLAGFLSEVAASHPEGDVAAVGHGGLFSTVLPRLCAIPEHDGISPLRLRNTAVTVMRHEGGQLACEAWGGVDHLPAPPDLPPGQAIR